MFIVIEGLDGSGKSTQTELTNQFLMSHNIKTRRLKFPNYSDPSSTLLTMYLNGEFGTDPNDVNPFAASSFYAVDRYASYSRFWKEDYLNGVLIISDRYTTSNAVHHTMKLPEEQWDYFLEWLEDFEYGKLGIPKPDLVVFLDMPVDVSQKLMTERYHGDEVKKDVHESNTEYLLKCRETALYAANKYGWKIIQCAENGEARTIEAIQNSIIEVISKEIELSC